MKHPLSRPFHSAVSETCRACNGEGELPVYALDGTPLNATTDCPICRRLGRVLREQERDPMCEVLR